VSFANKNVFGFIQKCLRFQNKYNIILNETCINDFKHLLQ
jgi:hypothetical protein